MQPSPDATPGPTKRPLRFKIGIGLLALYPMLLLAAAVIPFLSWDGGVKAAAITGDLVASEIVFFLGVALIGKEAYQALKARFSRKERRGTPRAGTDQSNAR